jgi:hypothetical protein
MGQTKSPIESVVFTSPKGKTQVITNENGEFLSMICLCYLRLSIWKLIDTEEPIPLQSCQLLANLEFLPLKGYVRFTIFTTVQNMTHYGEFLSTQLILTEEQQSENKECDGYGTFHHHPDIVQHETPDIRSVGYLEVLTGRIGYHNDIFHIKVLGTHPHQKLSLRRLPLPG